MSGVKTILSDIEKLYETTHTVIRISWRYACILPYISFKYTEEGKQIYGRIGSDPFLATLDNVARNYEEQYPEMKSKFRYWRTL